jgi:hypothetical protein
MRPLITHVSEAIDDELIAQGLTSDIRELPDGEAMSVCAIKAVADWLDQPGRYRMAAVGLREALKRAGA